MGRGTVGCDHSYLRDFYTRYPVYEENMDTIVGMFYSKMFIEWSMHPEKTLGELIDRKPLYVVQSASVEKVFKMMLAQKQHMAIVLDEYGGTLGIVTHEDIIEEMIGEDIEDETDFDEELLVYEKTDNRLVCHGRLEIIEAMELLDIELPTDHDTLGGFVLQELGHVPEVGLHRRRCRWEGDRYSIAKCWALRRIRELFN